MEQRVFTVIAQVVGVPIEEVTLESSPDTIDQWDSLKHMNVIMALEQEFDVQFSEEQIVYLENVELVLETLKEMGLS